MAERIEGLNLVLLGKIGAGKSASGNTILGKKAFESKESFTSVTQDVAVEYGWVCGRRVTVYDTPGLFNTKLSEQEIQQMINVNVLQRCESGLCVFLLVIKADRFTGKEREAVEKIEKLLGEERLKKTWILFTGRDELEEENMSIDEFVYETEALKRLVQKYNQRYHVFNNKKREPNGQVQELLTKIYSTHPDTIEKGAKPKRTQTGRQNLDFSNFIAVNSVFRSPVKHVRMRTTMIKYTDEELLRPVRLIDEPYTSRRIVLLGKTGVGKSASGNTILGQRKFRSERSMRSVTCECSEKHATVSGRSVTVVDTPGLFHTQMNSDELMTEIAWSVYLFSHGPHAFLIVLNLSMIFIEQEQQIAEQIKTLFGEEVLKYSIILFTHGDLLEGKPMEKLIKENSRLRDLVGQCGGRYHVFNNKDMNNRDQVNDLLKKIDTMIEQNGGGHYSHQKYEDPLRFRQEKEERRWREEEERKRREEARRKQEKKLRQGEIERVRKETKDGIKAEFEGTPRFLQKRLKIIRMNEEDRKQLEETCEEIEGERIRKRVEEQRQQEIERVIKDTERRIREEFEGPPRFLLERFKLMRLREEAEKTHREEIERVRKETEERVRAEFEGPPRVLLERLKAMTLSEEEEKTQQEEKQRREEIERVKRETEEKIRAEFDGPPRFLQERLKTIRLSMEDRIQEEVEQQEELERYLSMRYFEIHELFMAMTEMEMREMEMREMHMRRMEMREMEMIRMRMQRELQEEIERVIKEMEENIRAEFKCPPR